MEFKKIYTILFVLFAVLACTPKVTKEAQTTKPTTPVVKPPEPKEEDLSPCPKFKDAPNPDEAETNYVLYRDFMKVKDWDQAYDYWQKVFAVAPAADGRRNTVYADGIRFYEHFYAQTQDATEKESYINKIFDLYDQIDACYNEGGYIAGRKAFDLYYKYKDRAPKEEIYKMFKQSIDMDGEEAPDFVVNPFTSLLVELYFKEKVSMEEAQKYTKIVKDLIAKGVEDCKGVGCKRWEIIQGYAPIRLEQFETVKGFYDCDYYMDKYYPEYEEAMKESDLEKRCDVLRTVYSRLKWGGCSEAGEKFQTLISAGNTHCVEETAVEKAYEALRNGEYNEAITLFEAAANEEEDTEKKGKYLLVAAKVYHAHLKSFSKARQYARRALEVRPNWGDPYLLIGRLYASSGPLCGPGRGWDSQIVVWPAIDMWAKAKRVDPSVTAEANKWIGRYRQYMPNKEDVFIRNLKAGQSFRIGCWIQETTTIRTSD